MQGILDKYFDELKLIYRTA
jgi:hypothetical protein